MIRRRAGIHEGADCLGFDAIELVGVRVERNHDGLRPVLAFATALTLEQEVQNVGAHHELEIAQVCAAHALPSGTAVRIVFRSELPRCDQAFVLVIVRIARGNDARLDEHRIHECLRGLGGDSDGFVRGEDFVRVLGGFGVGHVFPLPPPSGATPCGAVGRADKGEAVVDAKKRPRQPRWPSNARFYCIISIGWTRKLDTVKRMCPESGGPAGKPAGPRASLAYFSSNWRSCFHRSCPCRRTNFCDRTANSDRPRSPDAILARSRRRRSFRAPPASEHPIRRS